MGAADYPALLSLHRTGKTHSKPLLLKQGTPQCVCSIHKAVQTFCLV